MKFIDSNIFVYSLAADPLYGDTAKRILSRIEQGEEVTTSTHVINQVFAYLRWKKKASSIPVFLDFIQSLSSLTKRETLFTDFVEARTRCSENWGLYDDYIIVNQMERVGISEIYSNDSDFDRIQGIQRLFG